MKKVEDDRGDPRWIEEMGRDGKPNVFYRYDSNGRLKKYTRKIFGYDVTPAEYVRFGDQVNAVTSDAECTVHSAERFTDLVRDIIPAL